MTTTAENQDLDPAGEAGKRVREESRIRGGGSMEPIVAYDPLHGTQYGSHVQGLISEVPLY
jgi:hypothetical protein